MLSIKESSFSEKLPDTGEEIQDRLVLLQKKYIFSEQNWWMIGNKPVVPTIKTNKIRENKHMSKETKARNKGKIQKDEKWK